MSGFNSGAGSDYGNYSVQDTNIKQGQYVVNTNASFTSVEGSKVVGTDNIESNPPEYIRRTFFLSITPLLKLIITRIMLSIKILVFNLYVFCYYNIHR